MEDERAAHLRALAEHLKAHGLTAGLANDDFRLNVQHAEPPYNGMVIFCIPRGSDAGRLWFTADSGYLAEADNIIVATTAIKGRLTPTAPRS
jgi:hypothetical protein